MDSRTSISCSNRADVRRRRFEPRSISNSIPQSFCNTPGTTSGEHTPRSSDCRHHLCPPARGATVCSSRLMRSTALRSTATEPSSQCGATRPRAVLPIGHQARSGIGCPGSRAWNCLRNILALATASHSGYPVHLAIVEAILHDGGLEGAEPADGAGLADRSGGTRPADRRRTHRCATALSQLFGQTRIVPSSMRGPGVADRNVPRPGTPPASPPSESGSLRSATSTGDLRASTAAGPPPFVEASKGSPGCSATSPLTLRFDRLRLPCRDSQPSCPGRNDPMGSSGDGGRHR